MRTTSHDDPSRQAAAKDAPPKARRQAPGSRTAGAAVPAGVAGLQAAAGNRAVVQLLRRAGHPWAQERHEHGAGCGHRTEPAAARPTVQRAPNVQDRLTDAHWAEQARGKPEHGRRPASRPRSLEDVLTRTGPALLAQLRQRYAGKTGKQIARMGQLELFRTMDAAECDAIMTWWNSDHQRNTAKWMRDHKDDENAALAFNAEASRHEPTIGVIPVRNHLGDERQARRYLDANDSSQQRMVKFTLRPDAHELLFDPQYMAVSGTSAGRAPQSLRNIHGDDRPMPEASTGEGVLGGHIGMKQERHGDFSISLGSNSASQLLFQQFLTRVEIVE